MATKLHELLAAEGNLETQAIATRSDLSNSFEKKRHLFEETRITFVSNEEGKQPQLESISEIQSTVPKELEWLQPFLAKAIDASYQVDETNTQARGDIILDDETNSIIATAVPATALLELEKRLTEWVLNFVKVIPTLDPAKGFQVDPSRGDGYYKARDIQKTRTKKDSKVITLAQPTKEHPAQVQLVPVDVPIGTINEQQWSGLITPKTKADMLDRAETLIRAVKRARSRANEAEVDTHKKIAKNLLQYVFDGKTPQVQ